MTFDFDVCLIVETHLKNDENIHVPEFNWIGRNIIKCKRPSGGLSFLINLELYSLYNVRLLENSFEGVIVISLSHKHSGFSIIIVYSVYSS